MIEETENTSTSSVWRVLCQVEDERERQDAKWGVQDYGVYKWLTILGKKLGDANKAALEDNAQSYRDELIQIAAVAVAMIECHDDKMRK